MLLHQEEQSLLPWALFPTNMSQLNLVLSFVLKFHIFKEMCIRNIFLSSSNIFSYVYFSVLGLVLLSS